MADVPEVLSNVCGTINGQFMITEMADEPHRRDYGVFNAFDHEHPETPTQVYIASPEVPRNRWKHSMDVTRHVLESVRGRSLHFPRLVKAGRVGRLIFGAEGVQEFENDPEGFRTVLVIQYPLQYKLLSHLSSFSPTGTVPVELALHIGWGMVRALAALHRAGFVHRLVSPSSFSFVTPPTVDNFVNRLLITELSLCIPWPRRPRPRVPFVGVPRYCSPRAENGRETGPADDVISVVYVIAELVSGRLPWRSVKNLTTIAETKVFFSKHPEFHRLPREIRALYRDMMLTSSQSVLDYQQIQGTFKAALARRPPRRPTTVLAFPAGRRVTVGFERINEPVLSLVICFTPNPTPVAFPLLTNSRQKQLSQVEAGKFFFIKTPVIIKYK